MDERIDLHTHTTASDGIYSPVELIDLAKRYGLRSLAITDHDTVGGLDEAVRYAGQTGVELIPGIEFSVDYEGGSFHLVGLYIDYRNLRLVEATQRLQERRSTRIARIIDDLAKHDIVIPLDEVLAEAGGESMGRPHVARVLVRHGFAEDMNDVFRRFMVRGRPGYIRKEKIARDEAVSLIHESGGVAVIAHPISLNFGSFRNFIPVIENMIRSGIDGIEVYASMHGDAEVGEFLEIARRYELLVSGGSDFHGDKDEEIGQYHPDKNIPVGILDAIRRRAAARKSV